MGSPNCSPVPRLGAALAAAVIAVTAALVPTTVKAGDGWAVGFGQAAAGLQLAVPPAGGAGFAAPLHGDAPVPSGPFDVGPPVRLPTAAPLPPGLGDATTTGYSPSSTATIETGSTVPPPPTTAAPASSWQPTVEMMPPTPTPVPAPRRVKPKVTGDAGPVDPSPAG